ncbi:DUF547 domain-containing protein [Aquiflexum sp.]|uniref:DUF547 domain-containing protein n=1 Tax=Aquiflexum sp. TaxID=1872584 RepID=UPI0035942C08
MKTIFLAISFLLFNLSCGAAPIDGSLSSPPSHEIFDGLLKKHVSKDGKVNYKGFIADMPTFEKYLKLLSDNAPDRKTWTKDQQLAYWINAYNAFTIKIIADNYPVESIKDLNPNLNIPMVHTVWTKKFIRIGMEDVSLDDIEHKTIRKEFEEPRIHFAVNCASVSCPPLQNEAFKAENLDSQLENAAKAFVNNPKYNKISKDKAEVSQIFSWFKGDFTNNGSLIDYLNKYSKVKINSNAKVSNLKYDWALNE